MFWLGGYNIAIWNESLMKIAFEGGKLTAVMMFASIALYLAIFCGASGIWIAIATD